MMTTALTSQEQFLLEWLGKEDSSALGECEGQSLTVLVNLGLAEIGPPRAGLHPHYRRVSLTDAGRAIASPHSDRGRTDMSETAHTADHLLGLLWVAYHEFNAIRARSGAPIDHYGVTLCTEEYWSQMTDAFYEALPEKDRTPWPSDRARAAISKAQKGEPQ